MLKVAVIDDDFRIRESIESLTASAGYSPKVFESAEEFLQSGLLADWDCVITDVRMPGIDGLELQRRIRLERPQLPVIFISAHLSAETRARALDGGAIDFLYKPFDAAGLLKVVAKAFGGPSDNTVQQGE